MHNAQFNISFDCQTFEEFRNAWGLVHDSPYPVGVTVNPPKVEVPNDEHKETHKIKSFDYSAPFGSFEDAYLAATGEKRFPYGSSPPKITEREARERFAEGLCAKIGLDLSRLQIEKEEEPETSPTSPPAVEFPEVSPGSDFDLSDFNFNPKE